MKCIDPAMLTGQVAWVTASARGIGRAIAERLARCGASIVIHSRSDQTAAEFGEAPSCVKMAGTEGLMIAILISVWMIMKPQFENCNGY